MKLLLARDSTTPAPTALRHTHSSSSRSIAVQPRGLLTSPVDYYETNHDYTKRGSTLLRLAWFWTLPPRRRRLSSRRRRYSSTRCVFSLDITTELSADEFGSANSTPRLLDHISILLLTLLLLVFSLFLRPFDGKEFVFVVRNLQILFSYKYTKIYVKRLVNDVDIWLAPCIRSSRGCWSTSSYSVFYLRPW